MTVIGQGISLRGMTHEKSHYPFYLAAGTVVGDIGKAVSIDASAANTVKLAADGDQVIGQLVAWEDRSVEGVLVGTVALKGGFTFVKDGGATVIVGDTAIGAGGGEVKAAVTADHADNIVVEVVGNDVTIIR